MRNSWRIFRKLVLSDIRRRSEAGSVKKKTESYTVTDSLSLTALVDEGVLFTLDSSFSCKKGWSNDSYRCTFAFNHTSN